MGEKYVSMGKERKPMFVNFCYESKQAIVSRILIGSQVYDGIVANQGRFYKDLVDLLSYIPSR